MSKTKNTTTAKTFAVRYGRNYKVVLAIILPCLLIIPFVLLLQVFKSLEEWKIWLIIFVFLGAVISLCLWLVLRVYPPTELNINENEISLSFAHRNFLSPADFSFNVADITSFTRHEIRGDEYFVFETRNPARKFQISPSSDSIDDFLSFNEALTAIGEAVNKVNNANE